VVKSLEKIAKEGALKKKPSVPDDVISNYGRIENNPENVKLPTHFAPLLKLKIRNTTQYLNWRQVMRYGRSLGVRYVVLV
jgi:hypothetical protein